MDFKEYMALSWQRKLEEFMKTRSVTNRTPDYYVNWEKVRENATQYELELNTLNYLVGKNNIVEESIQLFTSQPNLLKAVPTLIANRDYDLDILRINDDNSMSFNHLDFTNIDETKIRDYVTFMEESGLLNFLQNDARKSLVDYAFGVEAGLDSNGRKNRSGTQNEEILEINLKKLVDGTNWEYETQIGVATIKDIWDIDVPTDRSSRRFDGAVYNPDKHTVTLIETNFYGGGGSKLKAVSGEFRDLNGFITKVDVQFVWISDGMGWDTARLPLSEAFEQIPFIINLNMVNNGYLKEIVEGV